MEPTKTPTKKTAAKKKTATPTVTGTDDGLVALGRHLARDHRLMEHEIRDRIMGYNLDDAAIARWHRLWTKIK
jgi:hypothetical protein